MSINRKFWRTDPVSTGNISQVSPPLKPLPACVSYPYKDIWKYPYQSTPACVSYPYKDMEISISIHPYPMDHPYILSPYHSSYLPIIVNLHLTYQQLFRLPQPSQWTVNSDSQHRLEIISLPADQDKQTNNKDGRWNWTGWGRKIIMLNNIINLIIIDPTTTTIIIIIITITVNVVSCTAVGI